MKSNSIGTRGINRRQLVGGTGLAMVGGLVPEGLAWPASYKVQPSPGPASNIYGRLGVRPLINCKGTFTIITGSLSLPEVKEAMDAASRHYVHMDELMEAVGRRLAELTGAASGIVTAGCSAAATLATCACVAGGDPEKIRRLPKLEGLKDEVVIPRYSRNVYDQAVRMVGVRVLTASNLEELKAAVGPRTAMIYVLACPEDTGPFGLEPISLVARSSGVPVLVDAAAEDLTPQIHFRRGADLVAYSGGKALRGPQAAGLLLGRKDLCRAAWLNSAPHHAFGRSLKVGKEEIMGMLAAVEAWYQRDHEAEWQTWERWLAAIASPVEEIDGVSSRVIPPESLSNRAPRLSINWDGKRLGITGQAVYETLLNGTPRIILARAAGSAVEAPEASSIEIMPWMMQPGDAERVAAALHGLLSNPPRLEQAVPAAETVDVQGSWSVELSFSVGNANHALFLEQEGDNLAGSYVGSQGSGRVTGRISGKQLDFKVRQPFEGAALLYAFQGEASANVMQGTVQLDEYGTARWEARRLIPR